MRTIALFFLLALPLWGARNLNGSNQKITVSDNAALQLGTGSFTLTGWVYPSTVSYGPTAQGTLVSKHFTGVEIFLYQGDLRAYIGGTSNDLAGTAITTNTWHHVALVRNGSACLLYLNGVSVATATNSANMSNASTELIFGTRPTDESSKWLHGALARWGLYSVGLSASDVGALAKGAPLNLVRPDALVEWWEFDGRTAPERGYRRGLTGALSNSPTRTDPPRLYRSD